MGEASERNRKRELRAACKWQLAQLPSEYIEHASESISGLLQSSYLYRRAQSLFIYISMEKEPDTGRIIENAWQDGKVVYVPLCREPGKMDAVRISDWGSLRRGRLGLLEPQEADEKLIAQTVDLCVVPCVCAGKDGRRLGHGGGYYDRWLKAHAAPSVCLCFERMIRDGIPWEAWDMPMDHVLTENGFFPALHAAER